MLRTNKVAASKDNGFRPLQCATCGDMGDVVWRTGHVGGQGYDYYPQCRDEVACSRRWDEAHGITGDLEHTIRRR
jgi:hypothetical protein